MEDKKFKYPKVSIILSVYNGEKYLQEAIESVLNQTFVDFEFIIIDDGSTDQSLKIIKRLQKTDNRIVLISRENKGLIFSLNEGIDVAKGKYIARMDADDICIANRFEKQVEVLDKNQNIIVCGSWVEIFNKKNKNPYIKQYPTSNLDIQSSLILVSPFAHPAVMIRRSILITNNIRYNHNFLHAEDYQLWVELSNYGEFFNIDEALLKYRYLEDSITRVADNQEKERIKILGQVFKQAIKRIGLNFDDKEALIHYQLSTNTRLNNSELTSKEIINHLDKILSKTKTTDSFNHQLVEAALTKRCVWFLIYKKDWRICFSRYFFKGLLNILTSKI